MKKRTKIICMLAICVSLCINVSNALEFSETVGVSAASFSIKANNTIAGGQAIEFGDYNFYDFLNYTMAYVEGGCEDATIGITTNYHNIFDYLTNNGYSVIVGSDGKQIIVGPSSVDFGCSSSNSSVFCADSEDIIYYCKKETDMYRFFTITCTKAGYTSTFGSPIVNLLPSTQNYFCNKNIKNIYKSGDYYFWDGTYSYQADSVTPDTPVSNSLLTSEEFNSMLTEITTSELFYQHIPSDYRKNFFVQYDVDNKQYVFYFYPSNYQVNGLKMNENDYYLYCDKDFSWWDKVVESIKHLFSRETENLDYKIIYVSVEEDNTYSPWYRSKTILSVEETLFNFDLHPIVYATKAIPFYGKHGGGGINIDTGDETLASSSESMILENIYGEDNIAYNANPVETIANEKSFWEKVVNRLSTLTSTLSNLPDTLIKKIPGINAITLVITIISPLGLGVIKIIQVLISSTRLVSRAVTFIYTLPTIKASSALFAVDVANSSKGIIFTGHSWGTKFIEGLEMLKSFSWNGLNLWNLFSAFIAAMFTIQIIKYVRKHYHV